MLYIVRVYDDGETYEYEYGDYDHASDHFNWEKTDEYAMNHLTGKNLEYYIRTTD